MSSQTYTKAQADTLLAAKETAGAAAAALAGLTKASVGLGSVDNTSDAAKPISTAQATVNAAKADLVGGLVPTSQIPALALTSTFSVASQAAMLALTTTQVQPGDVAVRTDGAGTFILTATDPTQLANWVKLNAPTDVVTTVNGQQGTVVLSAANVGADPAGAAAAITPTTLGLGNVSNTSDAAKPVSTAQATAIANTTLNLPVNVMTTSGTALIGARNSVDASAGPVTIALPTPTVVGQHLILERADTSTTAANVITVTGTIRGAASSVTLAAVGAAFEGALYIAESLTSWAIASSIKPRAVLDAAYDAKGTAAGIVANLITYVDNGDGTATITGPSITDNGDGTVTFSTSAGSLLYKKTQIDTLLNAKAPLASPGFTGTPTAPTVATSDSSTSIATTAFVKAQGYGAGGGGGTAVNVQTFTSSGTWTKPAGVTTVQVTLVGAGGGGGSGRRQVSGTIAGGGGGGGGGGMSTGTFPAAALPATVAVACSAGGAGGGAITTDSTNGANGGGGAYSTFGTFIQANGGNSGGGGSTAGGSAGGAASSAMFTGNGAATGGAGAAGGQPGSTPLGGAGGGGGGGISTTPAAFNGGIGGAQAMYSSGASAPAGVAPGGTGTSGNGNAGVPVPGCGGAGGASSITGAGGAGGVGGFYGGGGGGGGASLNGFASGAGGAGGSGIVVVTSW